MDRIVHGVAKSPTRLSVKVTTHCSQVIRSPKALLGCVVPPALNP